MTPYWPTSPGLATQQRRQGFLVIAGGDLRQIEPINQLLDAAGPLQVGRQQAAVGTGATTTAITHLGHLHADISDLGLDCALGQVAVTDHGLASIVE